MYELPGTVGDQQVREVAGQLDRAGHHSQQIGALVPPIGDDLLVS